MMQMLPDLKRCIWRWDYPQHIFILSFSFIPYDYWYLQQLARYTYPTSIAESIKIQKSSFKKNTQLLKPSTGIDYTKISYIHQDRLNNIRTYMRKFSDYSELFLSVNATLDNLSFGIEKLKFPGISFNAS